jgi:hypothetical protein
VSDDLAIAASMRGQPFLNEERKDAPVLSIERHARTAKIK